MSYFVRSACKYFIGLTATTRMSLLCGANWIYFAATLYAPTPNNSNNICLLPTQRIAPASRRNQFALKCTLEADCNSVSVMRRLLLLTLRLDSVLRLSSSHLGIRQFTQMKRTRLLSLSRKVRVRLSYTTQCPAALSVPDDCDNCDAWSELPDHLKVQLIKNLIPRLQLKYWLNYHRLSVTNPRVMSYSQDSSNTGSLHLLKSSFIIIYVAHYNGCTAWDAWDLVKRYDMLHG